VRVVAVEVGSAVGYLDLDISGFLAGLKTAQSEASKTSANIVTSAGNKISGFGKKISSAGSTLTKTVTLPIAGMGAAAIKTSSDFESAMSKVSAISGATGGNLDKLSKKAQEMGAKTKFSATESAEAFTYMAMAGWKTEDMLQGIDGIMSLAAADGLDLATTSDIVTDALTAFGLSAKDSGHFADVLAKASSSANTNVSMLGESFKYVAPVAGALGYSAEDTAIALGLMANAGIKGSQGGTALRASLSRLIKPTDDAAALMEKYDISLTNTDGTMKSLGEVMDMLRENLGGLTEAEQANVAANLFGQEAMSGMLSIINASDKDYQSLTDSIYDADGAAQKMSDTMLNNLSGQLTLLKSALEGLAIQFGEILMPYIKKFVTWLQNLTQKLQELSPEQKDQIVKWAAIAASIGPVLLVLGKLITGVGGVITTLGKLPGAISKTKTGFKALTTGFKNIGEGFKLAKAGYAGLATQAGGLGTQMGVAAAGVTGPMIAIIATIALLAAAFVSLWKRNEEFRDNITAIWDKIKATFEKLTSGIVDRLNQLGFDFENIGEVLKAIWTGWCDMLAPYFEGVFNYIAIIFDTYVNIILGVVDFFIALFKGDWQGCWDAIKSIFMSYWNGMKDWFMNILNVITGILDVVLGWFGTSWSECWNSIKEFFVNIWTSISTWFQNALTNIATFFSNIWNGIVTAFTTAWEFIKGTIQSYIQFIVSIIVFAFDLITIPFRFIWENCKETIMTIWNAIVGFISNVWDKIVSIITTVASFIKDIIVARFNFIKNITTTVWNAIKTVLTTVWNAIKTFVTTVIDSIKTTITNVWNAIKNTATTVWNAIKNAITTPFNAAKDKVSNIVNSIKTIFSNGFNAAKNTVTSIFDSIKSKISNTIESAKTTVTNGVNKLKSAFNFSWSLPKLKLPHISVTGGKAPYGIGGKGSLPRFSIEWYKKAMNGGMILNAPTIFGFNPESGKFLGGGEAGSETVVGTKSLLSMIRQTVAETIQPMFELTRKMARVSTELGYVAYNGFARQTQVFKEFVNSKNNDSGGDTFIFHSPKPIDEIEAARQVKKTKRELAEGF
jgi:TP901 family phage tail tape measure protein